MQIVGMDIHRSFAQVAILEDGTIIRQLRVDLVHDRLVAFAKALSLEDEVVIELTGNSAAVERILRPHVKRVAVANPRLVRAIAYARVKTDKVDAGTWQSCMLPASCRRSGLLTRTPTAAGARWPSALASWRRSSALKDA